MALGGTVNITIKGIDNFSETFKGIQGQLSQLSNIAASTNRVTGSIKSSSMPINDQARQAGFAQLAVEKQDELNKNLAQQDQLMRRSFFGQATFGLMAQTGQKIAGVGDQISRIMSNMSDSRRATDEAKALLKVIGFTEVQTEKLEDSAESLGNRYGILKGEFLDAAYYLASGLADLTKVEGGEEALAKLGEQALQLSTTTKAPLETINKTLTKIANVYGIAGMSATDFTKEMTTASEAFFYATQITTSTGGDITNVVTKGAEGWKLYEKALPRDQLVVLGAALTDILPSSAIAGTAIKNLGQAWPVLSEKLKGYGVNLVDATGQYRPMVDVMGEVRQLTAKMGEEELQTFVGKLKMTKQTSAAFINIIKGYDKISVAMKGWETADKGQLALKANEMAENLTAVKDRANAARQAMMEAWGGAGEGAERASLKIKMFGYNLSGAIAKSPFGPIISGFAGVTGAAFKAAGSGMVMFGNLGKTIQSYQVLQEMMKKGGIPGPLGNIATYIGKLLGIIPVNQAVAASEKLKGQAGATAGKSVSKAWLPLFLIFTLLAGVLMSDKQLMKEFQSMFKDIGAVLKDAFKQLMPSIKMIMAALKPIISTLGKILADVIKGLMPVIKIIAQVIVGTVMPIIESVLPVVMIVASVIADIFKVAEPIISLLMEVLKLILPAIQPFMKLFLLPIQMAAELVKQIFYNIPDFLLPYEAEAAKYKAMADDESQSAETRAVSAKKYLEHLTQMRDTAVTEEGAESPAAKSAQKELDAAIKKYQTLAGSPEVQAYYSRKAEQKSTRETTNARIMKMGGVPNFAALGNKNDNSTNDNSINITVAGNADKETIDYAAQTAKGMLDTQGKGYEESLAGRAQTQQIRQP